MKNRIAILTICDMNLGNRLQNYALQDILKQLGFEVETIQRSSKGKIKKYKEYIRSYVKNDKYALYNKFNRKIKWSNSVISREFISSEINSKYDFFVVGSDQIWNITFDFITDLDFLPFIEKNKKVSYAASFGIDTIPNEKKEHIGKLLNDFSEISVRELSGVKIINGICNKHAELVLDPTLLVDKKTWKSIENRPRKFAKSNYLLKYFLGDDKSNKIIKKIADFYGWEIVDVLNNEFGVGPSEFLYLIDNASFICTDSFHASVFSYIYKRPFIVFNRIGQDEDMSSRLENFCTKFCLNQHRYESDCFSLTRILECDYENGYKILKNEKEKSINYLIKALDKKKLSGEKYE